MASLTLTEFIAEVKLTCRNLPTSDPWYPYITKFVNRARNKVIRAAIGPQINIDLFPELHSSWTVGPSTASDNRLPKPADAIGIYDVKAARRNDLALLVTPPNWATMREWPVTFQQQNVFATLSKDQISNYASIFTRKGNSVLIHPTPDAAHTDYFRFYGIKSETGLVNPADVFYSNEQWDDATVLWAAGLLQKRRGWMDIGQGLIQQAVDELQTTANVSAIEDLGRYNVVSVEGAPTRTSVYGRDR